MKAIDAHSRHGLALIMSEIQKDKHERRVVPRFALSLSRTGVIKQGMCFTRRECSGAVMVYASVRCGVTSACCA
jgi:hypothetical protein